MKFQVISLFLVSSAALACLSSAVEALESQAPHQQQKLNRRSRQETHITLVSDTKAQDGASTLYAYATKVQGRGLLDDLFGGVGDASSISNVNDDSTNVKTFTKHDNLKKTMVEGHDGRHNRNDKRSLFGDLFGGSSTTISNVNDNSKNTKTYNLHDNTDIKKSTAGSSRHHRERRGLLAGGDSINISNVNDDSRNTKSYNSHDNMNSYSTIKRKGNRHDRRGLLFGGSSTKIDNVNDNSVNTKSYNSHDNTKVIRTQGGGRPREESIHEVSLDEDDFPAEFFDRRSDLSDNGLAKKRGLFGTDSISISNVNDNSKNTKTYKSSHNKNIHKAQDLSRRSLFDMDAILMKKRNDGAVLIEGNQQVGRQPQQRHHYQHQQSKRELVTIQIINVNDNSKSNTDIDHGHRPSSSHPTPPVTTVIRYLNDKKSHQHHSQSKSKKQHHGTASNKLNKTAKKQKTLRPHKNHHETPRKHATQFREIKHKGSAGVKSTKKRQ